MVFFNYSTMQMAAKVVYYGPGLCGKTTNLQYIYGHTSNDSRGEMVSLETETDRTLFFDLLPIDVGQIGGFNTRIQLYTVPGQVFYNTTRKLVLKGVDGVVFVADSQRPALQANIESFKNLEDNLAEAGLSIEEIPLVLQFNKRDLPDIANVEELNQALNRGNWPHFEASAIKGVGVFETLKGISKLTLLTLKKRLARGADSGRPGPRPMPPRPPAAASTPAAAASPPAPAPAPSPSPAAAPAPAAGPAAAPPRPYPVPAPRPAPVPPPRPPTAAAAPPTAPSTPAVSHQTPPPLAPAAGPMPAALARPPAPPPAPAAKKGRAMDVLGELERIRKQTLKPLTAPPRPPVPAPPEPVAAVSVPAAPPPAAPLPPAATAPALGNGQHEISRDLALTLRREALRRAHRFSLSLQVLDDNHQVVETAQNLDVDLQNPGSLAKLLLHLRIAVSPGE